MRDRLQQQVLANFKTWPAGFTLPAIAIAGIAGAQFELRPSKELNAFLASCAYLLGMLTSVVFGVYPMVMPVRNRAYALTINNAKAGADGLKIGVIRWVRTTDHLSCRPKKNVILSGVPFETKDPNVHLFAKSSFEQQRPPCS